MHDNPYAAPQAPVRSPPGNTDPTARSGKQLALDVLRGLRFFLIRGIPAAALAACLCMAAAGALNDQIWGAVPVLQVRAWHLFAFAGAATYFPAGLCAGVLAGLSRPVLRRHWRWHAALSLAVCLPIGLLEWMLFSVSSPGQDSAWADLFFVVPFLPVPLLLWLFARPQRVRQSIDPA